MNTNHDALREALQIGGKYNWKGQPERLVYLGNNWSGNGYWHQFALEAEPGKVWCEVLPSNLHMIEKTALSQPMPEAAVQGWKTVRYPITEEMHIAAAKVLHRASGIDGLPQRMLDAMLSAPPAAPEGAKPCSYPVCGCQKVDPRTLKGCAAQPPHPQPQAQGAPTGCACRWDKDDNRVQTCERHQGWLDVVHEWAERAKSAEAELQSHREAIAKRDAALVACVDLLTRYRNETPLGHQPHMIAHEADAAITQANEVLGRKEGGV